MPIIQYANYVFTNDGQSDVPGFETKLISAAGAIRAAGILDVYVGYHGDGTGRFDRLFNGLEMVAVRVMRLSFSDARLVQLNAEMSAFDIHNAVNGGRAFFTWCDSDTRVRAVMGQAMPGHVKTF